MHDRSTRLALALAAALGAGGCVTRDAGKDAAPGKGEGASGEKAPAGDPAVLGVGKGETYYRIETLATRWADLGGEPGEAAASERRSLELAVAREVSRDLDGVLADLSNPENPRWRRTAAKGLGFVNSPRVRPALEKALASAGPDSDLVVNCLVSLGRIADPDTDDEPILALASSPVTEVRIDATLGLARVYRARRRAGRVPVLPEKRLHEAEATLMAALFDPASPFIRGHAAAALGALGSSAAEEALANALRDRDAFPRLSAAHALAQAGTERSVPPLLTALAEAPEPNMKTSVSLALGAIAERSGRSPPLADLGTDAAKWRAWYGR